MEELKKEWYVVNTISGHEYKVKEKLEMRINNMELGNNIFRVIVPERIESETKNGQVKEKVKKMFPGYILIEMVMSDEAWFIVRNTEGVTGFIGSSGKGAKPFPLLPDEVNSILKNMGISRVELNNEIEVGNKINIIDGPFKDMIGKIESIDKEHETINVLIDLFGQEISVEVNFSQIETI